MTEAKKLVISLNINLGSYHEILERMVVLSKTRGHHYVCFANVHMVIEAYHNKAFADQVNRATLVLPDGMPVVKALKFIHHCEQDRIAGMDVFPDLLKLAEVNELKILLFGSTPEVLGQIKMRAEAEFPKINFVGSIAPPFSRSLDDDQYINQINNSGANLIFVALGCPKQEMWMSRHADKIHGMLLGVGGAFPVYAGNASRAPRWMQEFSLEWLYRLVQEPGRMWKRYLTTNSMFVLLLTRELLFRRSRKKAKEEK